jgi:hypothetical protein
MQGSDGGLQPSLVRLVDHDMAIEAEPQYDHMWVSRDECAALIPTPLQRGAQIQMPHAVAHRLCVFHLADTTCEGSSAWAPHEIETRDFTLTVEDVQGTNVRLSVQGRAAMRKLDAQGQPALRMTAALRGTLRFDARTQSITAFDMVAIGDLETTYQGQTTSEVRGFAFERADGSQSGDRVPPHDGHGASAYWMSPGNVTVNR